MPHWILHFRQDESGAITVDWVVLTAGVVGLALAVVAVLHTSILEIATDLGASIAEAAVFEYDI